MLRVDRLLKILDSNKVMKRNIEIMKKLLSVLIVASMCLLSSPVKAQSGFFYGINFASGNIWTSTAIGVAESVFSLIPGLSTQTKYIFEVSRFMDGSERLNTDLGRVYGFKGDDLLNQVRAGAKLGWMGDFSPIGIYVSADYSHDRFKTQFAYQDEWIAHRIDCFKPGMGIRFSPVSLFTDYWDVYPILEIGTMYNRHFKYKGGFDNDITQINDGMSTLYSVGLDMEGASILLGCEVPHFDLFNVDFTPDGGFTYPYANVKSKKYNIYLEVNIGF